MNEGLKTVLPELIKSYEPRNVYNVDETGLFYQMLPHRTLAFKGETTQGGKASKARITVLLGANMDGSDKLKPLVIRKYKKPRCFRGVSSLPLPYQNNKKAWMDFYIFEQWF